MQIAQHPRSRNFELLIFFQTEGEYILHVHMPAPSCPFLNLLSEPAGKTGRLLLIAVDPDVCAPLAACSHVPPSKWDCTNLLTQPAAACTINIEIQFAGHTALPPFNVR